MGRSCCGGIPARGTSLLEDCEVGGRRADVRNTKKASVAEEQNMRERDDARAWATHKFCSILVRIMVFIQTARGSHWKVMRAGVGILEHRGQWVGQR